MKILQNLDRSKVLGSALLISLFLVGFINHGFSKAASGCPGSRPTAITGTVVGYGGTYNNWTVDVLVGIDLLNGSNQKVNPDGSILNSGAYSATDAVNPNLVPPGASSGPDRTFGANNSSGVLCVSSSVKTAWFELYPKDQHGVTDKRFFGGANDQRMPITANSTNTFGLRLPTANSSGGNTGDINGYVKYNNHSISSSNLRFRVFPTDPGTACGVQGFSAGADTVGISSSMGATYYLVKNLAGGQCNAARQDYKITTTCINSACGSSSKSITVIVRVANGTRPRVDFNF